MKSRHHVAPIADGGIDDGSHEDSHKDSDEETDEGIMKKRASLWWAIILSSLGKTFYPYSRYIRTLNLQDLEKLLFSLCPAVTITARISKHQK